MIGIKRRIEWIDVAKGVGILMVALGHNWLDIRYCYYIYAFHMPLFFLLAGYTFSDKREPKEFVWNKIKTLLIPYFFFAVCNMILYGTMSFTHGGGYDLGGEIVGYILQQHFNYLWFLPVLFLVEILTYILSRNGCLDGNKLGGVILLFVVLHILLQQLKINGLMWCIDLVPPAMVFLLIGKYYKLRCEIIKYEARLWFIGVLFVFSFILATVNFICFGSVDMWSCCYGNTLLFFPTAVAATYAVVLLIKKRTGYKVLSFLGKNSLIIYGLHRIVIELLFIIWNKMGVNYDGYSLQSVLMAFCNVIVVCMLLWPMIKMINKFFPWFIGRF